jgi:hypothetical protein
MPTRDELIAARMSVPEIEAEIGVDSLRYLSLEGLIKSIGRPHNSFCTGCLTGEYPVKIEDASGKFGFEDARAAPAELAGRTAAPSNGVARKPQTILESPSVGRSLAGAGRTESGVVK